MTNNEALQQSELWEISRQLVSFNTVSALSNTPAAEYIAALLEETGFTVRVLRETVQDVEKAMVLAWAGPEVPGGLILSGHIDVVPFDGQPGWRSDPLVMQLDGERIYGRGVTDMKVFLAQALVAAKRYPLKALKRPLVFIFTCDEEVAGQGASRLVHVLPQIFDGYPLPTVALIGEPTNFALFPAHKGYASFDLRVHGKGGHSSAPARGVSAIEKMAEVIIGLKEANDRLAQAATVQNSQLFPESPSSVFNCGVISGGLAPNMIAETCHLTVSIRVAPGDNVEEIMADLRERLEREVARPLRSLAPEGGIFIDNVIATPALRSPTDNAFCALLCRVMDQRADRGAPFATDGGQFQQLGINSYICGPGLLEEAHQPNESIPVAHFVTGTQKIEHVIHQWCMNERGS